MSKSPDTISTSSSSATSSSKWSSFFFSKGQSPGGTSTLEQQGNNHQNQTQQGVCEKRDQMEAFFGQYWSALALFNFDRAKEIADRGGESSSGSQGGSGTGGGGGGGGTSGNPWHVITASLSQLSIAERAYLNLAFLAPKGFLRKDSNLKSTLDSVKIELRRVTDLGIGMICGLMSSKHSFQHVARALLVVVNLRLDLMEFYERLSLYGSAKNVEISDLITDIEMILEKFNDEQKLLGESTCLLTGILPSLIWECQSICNLLRANHSMQVWAYMDSTIAIQKANTHLQDWNDLVQTGSSAAKKSTFYTTAPTVPSLFLWIKKLKGMLISKYTLYFYEVLAKQSNPSFEMKTYCTKLPVDYHSRLSGFQKKFEALCVCIVFDARGTEYYRHGYRFPGRKVEPVEGLESFPSIVSIPAKPSQYWPSIIMMIGDKTQELNAEKTVTVYDSSQVSGVQLMYFLQKIDIRMYIVTICEARKSDKDAHVVKFLQELAVELKGARIFMGLKNFKA